LTAKKIVSWPVLRQWIERERKRGRKIVFTNGVFDILHAGHLKTLEWAKRQGDILVVGLNSDASVRRLKGPKRPIVLEKERALLIAGLACVDFVVLFSEDTPARLLAQVKPDVLVKGGDYRLDQIVGRENAKKIVRIPLLKGKSTTGIVERVVKLYAPR
jgi:rfaE bifunctional protein nucleotidyltransferase chain/domain